MRVLITGADGFIGSNLCLRLSERSDIEVVPFANNHEVSRLDELMLSIDFVFHLAGVNRAKSDREFEVGNVDLTCELSSAVLNASSVTGKRIPILYTSSTQVLQDNIYGRSKRKAENILIKVAQKPLVPVYIFRLPNVFGKWAKPNYNSVVATFCYNIARELPIQVNDPLALISLVYIDDVIDKFIKIMDGCTASSVDAFEIVEPIYEILVGDLARQIKAFKDSRNSLIIERVGVGFLRALHATYISYLPAEAFAYSVPRYLDKRGVFVEMLKTPDCGQFSFFSTSPGITRGGHYHHSKSEKFLIINGKALFRFRNIKTGEEYELMVTGDQSLVIETVPGWTHDVTNVGDGDMMALLWSSEIFDRNNPDTYESLLRDI